MRGSGKTIDLAHRVVNLINSGEKNIMIGSQGRTYEVAVIVRCKDCKYNDDGECIIKAGWFPVKPGWFCADGERRDSNA